MGSSICFADSIIGNLGAPLRNTLFEYEESNLDIDNIGTLGLSQDQESHPEAPSNHTSAQEEDIVETSRIAASGRTENNA